MNAMIVFKFSEVERHINQRLLYEYQNELISTAMHLLQTKLHFLCDH